MREIARGRASGAASTAGGGPIPSPPRGADGERRWRPALNYKIGFWVVLSTLVALVGSAVVVLDRTIEGYLIPAIVNDTEAGYVFLDPSWYEGIDLLPMSYENNVRTAADFEAWKQGFADASLRASLHRPGSVDTASSTRHDGYELNKLLIDGPLIVYEAVPNRPNGKAVVIIPGIGHQGARDVMGVPSEYSGAYYHGELGARLAREGYAVYAPELTGWGERRVDVGSACADVGTNPTTCSFNVFSTSLAMYGISTGAIHLNESAKTVSHALSRHDRVAVAGLSNGCGAAAKYALANPGEVDAVVLASCVGRTHEWPMSGSMSGSGQNLRAEPVDSARALAPIPLYVSYGSQELGLYRYEALHGDVRRMVAEAYEMAGAPEQFDYVVHGGGHTFDFDTVASFLDRSY